MKKRNLLVFLLGGMLMVPTAIAADNDGYDDCNQEIHRGPVHMSYVLITYNDSIEKSFPCAFFCKEDAQDGKQ